MWSSTRFLIISRRCFSRRYFLRRRFRLRCLVWRGTVTGDAQFDRRVRVRATGNIARPLRPSLICAHAQIVRSNPQTAEVKASVRISCRRARRPAIGSLRKHARARHRRSARAGYRAGNRSHRCRVPPSPLRQRQNFSAVKVRSQQKARENQQQQPIRRPQSPPPTRRPVFFRQPPNLIMASL